VNITRPDQAGVDDYIENRRTGSFLLIDPQDGATLSAGLINHGKGEPGNERPLDAG
jgi:sulfate adenylyltransferase subunit 1